MITFLNEACVGMIGLGPQRWDEVRICYPVKDYFTEPEAFLVGAVP